MPKQATSLSIERRTGSLQDQLLAIAEHQAATEKQISSDFGMGPPPLYSTEDATIEKILQPKSIGARIIVWSNLHTSSLKAA